MADLGVDHLSRCNAAGLVTHVFTVSVIVGRAAERTAQNLMDTYLSYDGGIRAAIEADQTT
jgi:hypothetical protein